MKKLVSGLLILMISLSLAACGAAKLPEGFVEDDVVTHAKAAVELINSFDYETLNHEMRSDLKSALPPDSLKTAFAAPLAGAGAFKEYKTVVTSAGDKSQNAGEEFVYVVLVCGYESGTLTYTISFDQNMEIIGLYMK